ncbi:hypothetical protein [Hyphomonas johnsonii]|uniref:Uncharacterized protein n=1 Tax=Hyphomonas johnsonii MHS-2 TaxID=1280950 RepID=A0A059FDW9_9PROT|nr:hypothetical protein [Hyphomonas johnsonii]KCZ88835.1 hypothetical protein HJO_14999 [Hyphomonas johnsonii MHS-2]
MDQGFEGLIAQITSVVKVSESDAQRLGAELYRAGVRCLSDADGLFAINRTLAGTNVIWDRLFVAAIKDHVLSNTEPKHWVSDEDAMWLIDHVSRDGEAPLASEVDLLLQVIRYAEGASERLGRFVLQAACARITAAGAASREDVERVRRALIVPATDQPMWVTGSEAEILVQTNDSVAFALNDPSWNDLFARAISNHLVARAHPDPAAAQRLLARETCLGDLRPEPGTFFEALTPAFDEGAWFEAISRNSIKAAFARRTAQRWANGDIDLAEDGEADWFLRRVGPDANISLAERTLIDFLKVEAPGLTQGLAAAT